MKALRCGVLVAVSMLASSSPGQAQDLKPRFEHLSVEQGLSHAWVQSIIKDSQGFVWFGTQDGLNRYDGAKIKVYRHDTRDPSSLPSSAAAALMEDSRKRLWIGSGWGNRGVALYDREHDSFKTFLPQPGKRRGNNVRAMLEDRAGRIWLATDNGLARLDPESGTITRFPLVPDRDSGTPEAIVDAVFEDRVGRLWVGSTTGLLSFDRARGAYMRWEPPRGGSSDLTRAEIWDFYGEDGGVLWIAALGSGLFRLQLDTGHVTRYLPDSRDPESISSARVRRLVPDGSGRLYVGTENGGLNLMDLRTGKFTRYNPDPEDETGLNSGSIWSMYRDDQGILWIGTFSGGVSSVSPLSKAFQRIKARRGGLSDSRVSALMEDHAGNLWIGTDGGGLNKLDRKTGTYTYYRHDPHNRATLGSDAVWALLEDRQHNVWVGGWDSGFGQLDPASGRVTRYRHDRENPKSIASDHVWRILELRTGELLVVTHEGADLFDRRTKAFTRLAQRYPGADDGVLYSAVEDKQGNIWLTGIGPIARIDRKTGEITHYSNDGSVRNGAGVGWTQAALVDSAGNVWLGTDWGLGCVPNGGKDMKLYTIADGLPSNTIASLAEDNAGSIWLGTNKGLSKLVDAAHVPEQPVFLNFDVHDGLQGDELARNAACRGKSGELFFGGAAGLTSFDPERIRKNRQAPPVVLTDFKIFNKSVPIGAAESPLARAITHTSDLALSYKHGMVTFEFAALNFIVPQKNQYAYKLEGFDPAWNEVGTQRSATYTNLPAGTFTLRVRGSNNDGVWNEEGVSLRIHVAPPWWKTRWFLATIVLAFLGAIAGFYTLRVRQHLRTERQLRERVAAALADIKTLRGLLPICAWCKKVRDDKGYWSQIEEYVSEHSEAAFSHGICPDCRDKHLKREIQEVREVH